MGDASDNADGELGKDARLAEEDHNGEAQNCACGTVGEADHAAKKKCYECDSNERYCECLTPAHLIEGEDYGNIGKTNCGSKLVVAVEKEKISYRCRRGVLLNDEKCRSSRIAMYCSKPHITGVIEAVQTILGLALIERKKKKGEEEIFRKLVDFYRQKQFTPEAYEMLLKECVNRIDVYNEYINVTTVSGELQLSRRVVLRQKGFSQNKLTRLSKSILKELEK